MYGWHVNEFLKCWKMLGTLKIYIHVYVINFAMDIANKVLRLAEKIFFCTILIGDGLE